MAAGRCLAGELPSVTIVAYGLYGASAPLGPLPAFYRQDTLERVQMTELPPLLEETEGIVARACTRFGLEFRADDAGPAPEPLTIRVDHPRLQQPDGSASTSDSFAVPLGPGLHYAGFDFDAPWELVPGDWIFTLSYRGRTIAEKRFTVTLAPDAGGGCSKPIS
ncbi:MAG: DUF3859 domain-containing protein [Acidisphaera sp.]|nr:DUF3859 domain-containing protein [Acidisphaera sp.]